MDLKKPAVQRKVVNMSQDSDGVSRGSPDPGETGEVVGNQPQPTEERGYQPCEGIEGGYQPPGDGQTIEDLEMPTVDDTLEGDCGDPETD